MGIFSRNPIGDFNTQGQEKCHRCGDYYPERWPSHGRECRNPEVSQEDDE